MALQLLLCVMLVAMVTHAAPITKIGCITDCTDRPTGDYQSCLGCHVYASCVSGNLFDNRPCSTGLVWDDNAKRCLKTSSTCQTTTTTTTTKASTTTTHPSRPPPSTSWPDITTDATTGGMGQKIGTQGLCVSSCNGRKDGDYQSCLGCDIYCSCVNGILIDNRPCSAGLVWDDKAKQCLGSSSTCPGSTTTSTTTTTTTSPNPPANMTTTPSSTEGTTDGSYSTPSSNITDSPNTSLEEAMPQSLCVSSCSGRKDGDYQSCKGCHVYCSCVNGILIDNRPCSAGLVWDDKAKQCLGSSSTCPGSTTTSTTTTTTTTPNQPANMTTTPSSPEGTTDGSYSMPSSNFTASPNTSLEEAMPQSLCVSTCSGRKDGDYQSCNGCYVYCSCVNGILIDNRPCPSGLVWDDKAKQCLRSSSTCPGSTTTTTTTTTRSPPTNLTLTPSTSQPEFTTEAKASQTSTIAASPSSSQPDATTAETAGIEKKVVNNQALCVSSCVGHTTGDYQSCLGCRVYASCVNGILFDSRPCPTGLVWDDNAKRCLTTSSTCDPTTTTTTRAPTTTTTHPSRPSPSTSWPQPEATTGVMGEKSSKRGLCVSSCVGRTTGDYQSCLGCHVYASCVNGILFDNRPCPTGLVWDDNAKRCLTASSTCQTTTTTRAPTMTTTLPSRPSPSTSWQETEATTKVLGQKSSNHGLCVTSCSGRKDGDYQSCLGCHVYVSCVNGILIDNRPCPAGLVWDDNAKTCLRKSSTCQISTTTRSPTTTTTSKVEGTHPASTTHPETTATHTDTPHTTQGSLSRAPHH